MAGVHNPGISSKNNKKKNIPKVRKNPYIKTGVRGGIRARVNAIYYAEISYICRY